VPCWEACTAAFGTPADTPTHLLTEEQVARMDAPVPAGGKRRDAESGERFADPMSVRAQCGPDPTRPTAKRRQLPRARCDPREKKSIRDVPGAASVSARDLAGQRDEPALLPSRSLTRAVRLCVNIDRIHERPKPTVPASISAETCESETESILESFQSGVHCARDLERERDERVWWTGADTCRPLVRQFDMFRGRPNPYQHRRSWWPVRPSLPESLRC
jgi:hypothetical protein